MRYIVAVSWPAIAPEANPEAFARAWAADAECAAAAQASVPGAMGAFGADPQVVLDGAPSGVKHIAPLVKRTVQALADTPLDANALTVTPINLLDGSMVLRVTVNADESGHQRNA